MLPGDARTVSEKGSLSSFIETLCLLHIVLTPQRYYTHLPSFQIWWEPRNKHQKQISAFQMLLKPFFSCILKGKNWFSLFSMSSQVSRFLLFEIGFSPGLCDRCTVGSFSFLLLFNLWNSLKGFHSFLTITLCFVYSLNLPGMPKIPPAVMSCDQSWKSHGRSQELILRGEVTASWGYVGDFISFTDMASYSYRVTSSATLIWVLGLYYHPMTYDCWCTQPPTHLRRLVISTLNVWMSLTSEPMFAFNIY